SVDSSWVSGGELDIFTREPVVRLEVVSFALRSTYDDRVRLAKARRRFNKSIEHGLEVEGRAANDFEHVGGGGLLLQGFAQLVEQPRVLDGDDRLGGKGFDERDLLVVERGRIAVHGANHADHRAVADQWRRDLRVVSEVARGLLGNRWCLRVADNGRDLQRSSGEHRSSDVGARIEWNRNALRQVLEARLAFESRDLDHAVAQQADEGKAGAEQAQQIAHDRLEHRLGVGGRAADRGQDFTGRGLPLERLLGLLEQPHVLDRDHRLVREGFSEFNLLLGERLHLGATYCQGANCLVFSQQRNGEDCPQALAQHQFVPFRKLVAFCREVVHVDWFAICDRTSGGPTPRDRQFDEINR